MHELEQMMHGHEAIVNLVSLAIAFAVVLWGLVIFKIYIILVGLAVGAVLGALGGGIATESPEGALICGLVGALIGGALAWPLQRLLVFLIAGLCTGLVVVAILAVIDVPQEPALVVGGIAFITGGIVAMFLYEYIIIIVMAFGGAQSVFLVKVEGDSRVYYSRMDPEYMMEYILNLYSTHILAFICTFVMFILFALYFQKWSRVRQFDTPGKIVGKQRFRAITYVCGLLVFFGYVLWHFPSTRMFSTSNTLGIGIVTWPIAAWAISLFCNLIAPKGDKSSASAGEGLMRFVYLAIFGIVVIPIISWAVESVYNLSIFRVMLRERGGGYPASNAFTSGVFRPWFYYGFFKGPLVAIAAKWVCSLFVFPGIFYLVGISRRRGSEAAAAMRLQRPAVPQRPVMDNGLQDRNRL